MNAIRRALSGFLFAVLAGGVAASAAEKHPVPPAPIPMAELMVPVASATTLPAVIVPSAATALPPLAPAPPALPVLPPVALARVVPTAPKLVFRRSGLMPQPASMTSSAGAFVARAAVRVSLPKVTSRYGYRVHPITKLNHFHTGVDLRAAFGTTVGASMDGRVTFAGPRGGYGNLVVVDHGQGVSTYYGHLSSISAKAGAHVVAGEVIGRSGTSGTSTGPHLHYEVRQNGRPSNPFGAIRVDAAAPPSEAVPDGGDALAGAD